MTDLHARKQQLEARLAELRARLDEIEDELDDPVDPDPEDQAIELEDDEVLERLGQAALREIEAIRAALKRIEDGSYGICVRCGDEISDERLDLLPYTPLCRKCAA
ncbi:MAG: TraR/DksA C4-type zinc finger protein [Paracoccaceae bacterium]|nr:TraR/DksA C4-type zinc finger protein [Paracoccaceae bacterium]